MLYHSKNRKLTLSSYWNRKMMNENSLHSCKDRSRMHMLCCPPLKVANFLLVVQHIQYLLGNPSCLVHHLLRLLQRLPGVQDLPACTETNVYYMLATLYKLNLASNQLYFLSIVQSMIIPEHPLPLLVL